MQNMARELTETELETIAGGGWEALPASSAACSPAAATFAVRSTTLISPAIRTGAARGPRSR